MNAKSNGTQTILEEKLKGTETEFWITPAYSDFDQLPGLELAVEYAGGVDGDGEEYPSRIVREKLIPFSETPAQWKGDQLQHVYGYLASDRRTFSIAGHGFADWGAEERRILKAQIPEDGWFDIETLTGEEAEAHINTEQFPGAAENGSITASVKMEDGKPVLLSVDNTQYDGEDFATKAFASLFPGFDLGEWDSVDGEDCVVRRVRSE